MSGHLSGVLLILVRGLKLHYRFSRFANQLPVRRLLILVRGLKTLVTSKQPTSKISASGVCSSSSGD